MEKLKTIHGQEASSERSIDDLQRSKSRETLILRCQRIIFSAYRTDQYSDPQGYMTSLGAVLEQYPNDVIVHVSDPRTGVQRGCKWPPTISEIVEACDNRVAELEQNHRFETWGQRNELALPAPEHPKPTYDDLKAKYGPDWGIQTTEQKRAPTAPAPTIEQLRHHYQHYDLSFRPKKNESSIT